MYARSCSLGRSSPSVEFAVLVFDSVVFAPETAEVVEGRILRMTKDSVM